MTFIELFCVLRLKSITREGLTRRQSICLKKLKIRIEKSLRKGK